MSGKLGNEKYTVQEPLIRYAQEIGWEYISRQDSLSLRKGEGGLLFKKVLEDKLFEMNPGLINVDNINEVIQKIESVSNNIEGNYEILAWLRGENGVFDLKEKRQRNVTLVNFLEPGKNIFQVTDEWQYTNGREPNRLDVVFLINGIPVAVVETKSTKKVRGIEEGLTQIREYHNETPEMMTMPQIYDITHLIDFYYGVTWNLSRKNLFNWKDEAKGNYESKVKLFFERERFLRVLRDWILFFVKDDELQKTILRQHQSRAVDKVVGRCRNKDKKTGLIWHTQGSGKTFTMITAARMLLEIKDELGKPTVLLMIDRNELEGQLSGWVERILGELQSLDIKIERAYSKRRLQELLNSDFRGLIISMIHKFDGIPKNINGRENIYVLLDEAHRSVGGDLGNYLVAALPRATLIGFTGTPIDKTAYGQGTFKIFGKEDDKGYLDKYSIRESMEDGTTMPLKYTLAPNEIRVDTTLLDKEFLSLVKAEGISDIDELNGILDDAVNIKTFLKSRDRIKKVAEFVVKHYQESVEPLGYKAFLVAVDREACALYKEALDAIWPAEYSKVIYSSAQHDSEKYPLVYKHQITEKDEKITRKGFLKQNTLPKILIVTDKLLTGYDAPILYCMYLDKPMRDHVLLQAIARVNRPYELEGDIKKPCGLVVDFVGIFEKLENALAFDMDIVSGVIENIDVILTRFMTIMSTDATEYLILCKGPSNDKTIEKAIDAFTDQNIREKFYRLYKEIETLYEILSPSPELRDYIDDFARLTGLYQIIRNAYRQGTILYGDIARKTSMLVREKVETYGLDGVMKVVDINADTLKIIQDSKSSDNNKIINLISSIRKKVAEEGLDAPYLKSIGERAENIRSAYDDRQISTKDALKQMEEIVKEIVNAQDNQKETGVDKNTFSILWILKQHEIKESREIAEALNTLFVRYPHFNDNPEDLRQLKAEIYHYLLPIIDRKILFPLVKKIFDMKK